MKLNLCCFLLLVIVITVFTSDTMKAQMGTYEKFLTKGRSIIFISSDGNKIKLTPYGNWMVRIQAVRDHEEFIDNPSEMVVPNKWEGKFLVRNDKDFIGLTMTKNPELRIIINRNPLRLQFDLNAKPVLKENNGVQWTGDFISESFVPDNNEHFTGLGHGFFGKADNIDLKDQEIDRNYGTAHGDQAPLIVPFYLSSKGYGLFLNSTFTNDFIFNKNNKYQFSINDYGADGRMDYFFIAGPGFQKIIDRYTQLTGRPRLPQLAVFGLGLSDKANDENSKHPSDENWWKGKITDQRNAGIPFDHIINDNRWRAGGGKRCESYFDWDKTRYPHPVEYESWIKKNGLILTIDFNRCISENSAGWKDSFNVPDAGKVDHGKSAPDFTRKDVRKWFWGLFWDKTLNPKLHYPGDALWIDEFDELGPVADTVKLGNGKLWGEVKNYWFFLIAKTLVEDGWDKYIATSKRPFVWVRGMTAGAQRYGTLWTGDIQPDYEAMKNQIIAMQLAGLSGFPFEGHDAGGFYDWQTKSGPDADLYMKWSMAMGSFTPFWKPHGMGPSRWPLNRSKPEQETAKLFVNLRYQLLPYTYTLAYDSYKTGIPMARAMVIDYQDNPNAWKYDLQYMWGPNMLVAPNPTKLDMVTLWLPKGDWYDYWTNQKISGDKIIGYPSPAGSLVLLVKAGSVLPMTKPALSTAFINKQNLMINIYPGANGSFNLYEDDGVTEHYLNGQFRTTVMMYSDAKKAFTIAASTGTYSNAPRTRNYSLIFIDTKQPQSVLVNRKALIQYGTIKESKEKENGFFVDNKTGSLLVYLFNTNVNKRIIVKIIR